MRGDRNGRAENNFLPIPPMKGPFIDAHGGGAVGFKVPAQCSPARSLLWKQESVEMQRTSERAAVVAPGRPSVRPRPCVRRSPPTRSIYQAAPRPSLSIGNEEHSLSTAPTLSL